MPQKYGQYSRPNEEQLEYERQKKTHPIWRGIGLILMVVIPVLMYILSLYILEQNTIKNWFPIPTDILSPWGSDPLIFVKLLMTLFLSIVAFLLVFSVGSIFVRLGGPPRYGPLDSPPLTREEIQRTIVRQRPR
jgi:hypothetical protein